MLLLFTDGEATRYLYPMTFQWAISFTLAKTPEQAFWEIHIFQILTQLSVFSFLTSLMSPRDTFDRKPPPSFILMEFRWTNNFLLLRQKSWKSKFAFLLKYWLNKVLCFDIWWNNFFGKRYNYNCLASFSLTNGRLTTGQLTTTG